MDRAGASGFGAAEKEPVLFADRRGANGIFDEVVFELHLGVLSVEAQLVPETEGVVDGFAGLAFGAVRERAVGDAHILRAHGPRLKNLVDTTSSSSVTSSGSMTTSSTGRSSGMHSDSNLCFELQLQIANFSFQARKFRRHRIEVSHC